MAKQLMDALRKLTAREKKALREVRDEVESVPENPEDLLRRKVRVGSTEIPILNLNGLWALRKLLTDGLDEAEAILTVVWVLRNQHKKELLDIIADGVPKEELAAIGCEIDLAKASDILAAFEEMLSPFVKKKTGAVKAKSE